MSVAFILRELQHLGSTHGPGIVGNSLFGSAGIFAGSSFVTYKELSPGRQKEYLKKLETPTNGIHIYPEYIYIKFNAFIHKRVPVAELKQATLESGAEFSEDYDIIFQNKMFYYRKPSECLI